MATLHHPTRAIYLLPAVALAGLLAACSSGSSASGSSSTTTAAPPPAASSAATGAGTTLELTSGHLTDGAGRTVYLWVADTGSTSTCSGSCAAVWPAVTSTAAPLAGTGITASDIGTSKRADGGTQLTYGGHPLYYFKGDTAAGSTAGQGVDGFGAKWWELNATGQAITTSAPVSSSSSASSGGGHGY